MDGVTPESYGRQAAQLLPPGSAWTRDPESNLARLLAALGASWPVPIGGARPVQRDRRG